MREKKEIYLAPAIEVIQVANEGVMASSTQPVENRRWGSIANAGNLTDTDTNAQDHILDIFSKKS